MDRIQIMKINKIFRVVTVLFLVVGLFIGSIYFFNKDIMKYDGFRYLRIFVILFDFYPDDYGEVCNLQITTIKQGDFYEVDFILPYPGLYGVDLHCYSKESNPNYKSYQEYYKFNGLVDIEYLINNDIVDSKVVKKFSAFKYLKSYGGITIDSFRTSQKIPIDNSIKCRITFNKVDEKFIKKFKDYKLVVTKRIDL